MRSVNIKGRYNGVLSFGRLNLEKLPTTGLVGDETPIMFALQYKRGALVGLKMSERPNEYFVRWCWTKKVSDGEVRSNRLASTRNRVKARYRRIARRGADR